MSTSLQETGEKQVRIAWSTIKLPNGATQDDDNHAGCDPMNLSPYACSGLTTRKNNRTEKKIKMSGVMDATPKKIISTAAPHQILADRHIKN